MKTLCLYMVMILSAACTGRVATEKTAAPTPNSNIRACIACHGDDSMSGKPNVPPIGHLSADEMIYRINEIKENNPGLPLLAHTLTREEVVEIANYFAEVNKQ